MPAARNSNIFISIFLVYSTSAFLFSWITGGRVSRIRITLLLDGFELKIRIALLPNSFGSRIRIALLLNGHVSRIRVTLLPNDR